MKKQVHTSKAPKAIGPYSQAITLGNIVYTSGQLPMNPETMEITGDIRQQAYQSLHNLKAVLDESGASIETVVKTTCFLSDMNNFVEFNKVYAEIFGDSVAPARSCVEVARLPKDALIEIEAIAYIK